MTEAKSESQATRLSHLAQDRYRFGRALEGEPFAVPLYGPRLVKMLRGGSGSLRAELAAAYLAEYGTPPTQQALADALMAVEGMCLAAEPERLWMRTGRDESGALWLDLGNEDGHAVRIIGGRWTLALAGAPILFRRTALSSALPTPADPGSGDLGALWELLNVTPEDRPILAGWLVAALLPEIGHPVLLLTGEQGSGKSTAARLIAAAVDPSTVPLRKPPRDVESWTTAAAGSSVVALDNLSALPDWLSDALCRAVTGDGDVRRRLYSDGDLHVVSFRRAVILNGIDLGAVRDDLADRLVTVELNRITEGARRRETELEARWADAAPRILAGLLDLAADVLDVLEDVHLDESPRMADFARVLAAVDRVTGSEALARYGRQAGALASDAVSSDPVLSTLGEVIRAPWSGAVAELHDMLTDHLGDTRPPREWPKTARALAVVLKRRAPSLRRVGWTVEQTDERTMRGVLWHLSPPVAGHDETMTKSDEPVSSWFRHASRHAEIPPMTCEDAEMGQNHDEMMTNPTDLSVEPERQEGRREGRELSSSRHLVIEAAEPDPPEPLPAFTPPTGPGRCTDCGYHIATQGHREGCAERKNR